MIIEPVLRPLSIYDYLATHNRPQSREAIIPGDRVEFTDKQYVFRWANKIRKWEVSYHFRQRRRCCSLLSPYSLSSSGRLANVMSAIRVELSGSRVRPGGKDHSSSLILQLEGHVTLLVKLYGQNIFEGL